MKFKIFFPIFLIILGILTYFGYPVVKERYFKGENATESEIPTSVNNNSQSDSSIETSENGSSGDSDSEEDSAINDEVRDETDESGDISNITAEDCDDECANFKDSPSDLRYCQDVCGLSGTQTSENCDEKNGLDKDYCFKEQAVSKSDLNICESISDSKVKSLCRSRVTEDLLEKQTNE